MMHLVMDVCLSLLPVPPCGGLDSLPLQIMMIMRASVVDTVSYGRSKEENGGSVEMPIMISRTNTRLLMEGLHTESE